MNRQVENALEILKSGDPQAVGRAIESLQAAVYSFGMKVCGNTHDAEDTAQETLIRLARSLKEFPNARALAVWLYKVAKSQCLMSRRKSKFAPVELLSLDELMPRHQAGDRDEPRSWGVTPEQIVLDRESRARLAKAIRALPKHYRLVLILRDMEELNTREVAEVLGISEDTVKMRLHRARVFVRNQLEGHFRKAAAPGFPLPSDAPKGGAPIRRDDA